MRFFLSAVFSSFAFITLLILRFDVKLSKVDDMTWIVFHFFPVLLILMLGRTRYVLVAEVRCSPR